MKVAFSNKRIMKNALWIIVCKALQAIVGLLVSVLTARYLGPANYGLINYAVSLTTFLVPVAQLGLNATLVQELVNHPDEDGEILGSAIFASMISSIFCMLGIAAFGKIMTPDEPLTILVCSLYSIILIVQAFELLQYWFQAQLLSQYAAILTLIGYTVMSAYQIFLLATHKSVVFYAPAKVLEYAIIAVGLAIAYRKVGHGQLKISFRRIRDMLANSKYYMLSSLLVMTFAQADRIMIKMMIGDTAMGFYSAAVFCTTLTEFVFIALIDSFRPVILGVQNVDSDEYQKKMSQLYCIIVYLSIAQSIFIALLAKPIILILYGESYLAAVGALRLIVWYTTFSYIGMVRNVWILAERQQHLLWRVNLAGAVFNVILNAILIPKWGIEGASFASLVTQVFTNVGIGYIIVPMRENNRLLWLGICEIKHADKLIRECIGSLRSH